MQITRRNLLAGSGAFALATHPWAKALAAATAKKRSLLLVGTETTGKSNSKGVYLFEFDPTTGNFEPQAVPLIPTPAPTFLALSPGNNVLYVANESGLPGPDGKPGRGGMVTSFDFDIHVPRRPGWPSNVPNPYKICAGLCVLGQISQVSSQGTVPVYVSVDHTGHSVFVANYGSGSIASFLVDSKGALSDAVSTFQYNAPPDASNKRSHAHRVTVSPDNQYLLVNDLGLDMIHIYKLDASTAKLTPHGEWKSGPGDGPRGLRFHANHKIAYCVNETQPTVHTLGWDAAAGTLTTLQTVRFIPEGDSPDKCHPGDIVFDKGMKHAYVSTRRDNTVTVLDIAADGKLSINSKLDSGGVRPRDLTMDPTDEWVIVANQDSNNLTALKRDPKTGALSDMKKSAPIDQPMCVIFPERSSFV